MDSTYEIDPRGRPLTASSEVFSTSGSSLGNATGTYAYDVRGNVTNLAIADPLDNFDLLPGFKPVDETGEVTGVSPNIGHRQLGDTDRFFRYDNEGRQVLDFVDGVTSNDITNLAYDIAGRLRQVKRTHDPAIGFDSVATTAHAYDAAGRRVATQKDSNGTLTTESFYGDSSMPELIFAPPQSETSTSGRVKLHQTYLPGLAGTAAISGHDDSGQTVWSLADYGGSTRTYASANADGTSSAILHQNFDGQGLPISIIDSSGGKFSTATLPISFAGNHRDDASDFYAVGGANWYAADTGRRLASNASGGNDNYTLATDYGNARVGEVDQQTLGEVFWPRYKELLSDPSQLDNGYRQAFYVSAGVAGIAAVAAGGGAITVGLGGFGTAAAGTSATVSSAAVGGAIGTGVSVGIAAYKGESLSSAALIGAGGGIVGGAASGAIGLPGRLAASRLANAIAAGGAGGAAEGAFRATIDGQSVGGIARAAVTDGLIGAATAGLIDRTIVGIVRANQAVRASISKIDVAQTPLLSKGDALRARDGVTYFKNRHEIADALDGVTDASTAVARGIKDGSITVKLLSDAKFSKQLAELRTRFPGEIPDIDDILISGVNQGTTMYLRKRSADILQTAVHEGIHALDNIAMASGKRELSRASKEVRAEYGEYIFAKRMGLEARHGSFTEAVDWVIKQWGKKTSVKK